MARVSQKNGKNPTRRRFSLGYALRGPINPISFVARQKRSRCVPRRGIQLLELAISLTTSSLLIAGIGTSIFLASKGRDVAANSHSTSSLSHSALSRLHSDLAEAKSFSRKSAETVELTVADRTADGVDETLQYRWSGAGKPLQYSEQTGLWLDLTNNLDSFEFNWRSNVPQTRALAGVFDPPGQYVFQSRTSNSADNTGLLSALVTLIVGTELSVDLPTTFRTGDLLVAAIAVEGDQVGSISNSGGWQKIFEEPINSTVSLAAFYTFSTSSSRVTFAWNQNGKSNAVIAHFSAPSLSAKLDSFVANSGLSQTPESPAAVASNNNALAIRLIATMQTTVPNLGTNMPGHIPIFFQPTPALGMAIRNYPAGGTIPAANFGLLDTAEFATATLVFKP